MSAMRNMAAKPQGGTLTFKHRVSGSKLIAEYLKLIDSRCNQRVEMILSQPAYKSFCNAYDGCADWNDAACALPYMEFYEHASPTLPSAWKEWAVRSPTRSFLSTSAATPSGECWASSYGSGIQVP
jgi:hypothetical protein